MFLDKKNLLHFEKPKIYFLSVCILFALDGSASKDSLIGFSNPRAVVKNHLENLQNDHFFPENAAKSFRFSSSLWQMNQIPTKNRPLCSCHLPANFEGNNYYQIHFRCTLSLWFLSGFVDPQSCKRRTHCLEP